MRQLEIYSALKTAFENSVDERQLQQWARIYHEDCFMRGERNCPDIEELISRLKEKEPIQYVVGNARFYNLDLYVNESVLIPRPETEELVFLVKDKIDNKANLDILDIGTGSGCIPLLLKKLRPDCRVSACDISESALEVARINAQKNKLDVKFIKADILNYEEATAFYDKTYDLIISNPPYIPVRELDSLMPEVKNYEPHLALAVADDNPALFYIVIARFGKTHLSIGGRIYCEIHPDYADISAEAFSSYTHVNILEDMQGKKRFLEAIL